MVEHERDAEQRHALPRSRARARRPGPSRASRSPRAATAPRPPAVRRGLRRRAAPQGLRAERSRPSQRDDEAGLQQQRIHLRGCPRCSRSRPEPDPRRRAPRRAREIGAPARACRAARARACPPPAVRARRRRGASAAGTESRTAQLVHDREQRVLARIGLCRGNREGGMVETIVAVPPGLPESPTASPRAGSEWHRGPPRRSRHGLDGRRRPEHDRVLGGGHHGHPRSRQDRDLHGSIGTGGGTSCEPAFRPEPRGSRLVTRQSVTIAGYPCSRAHAKLAAVSATPVPEPRASGRVTANAR